MIKKQDTFVTLLFFIMMWIIIIFGCMFGTMLINEQLHTSQLENHRVDFMM